MHATDNTKHRHPPRLRPARVAHPACAICGSDSDSDERLCSPCDRALLAALTGNTDEMPLILIPQRVN